ncbi:4'-phosphopantetheinyl transferase EntD [Streptomyces zagrosensis]|uniref:4'-phosphopantetheinyl transferase EntD n=1 Tax=Streptomyces zagrosensis TaxID=1042984 RepID=A0A7W9V095_9ACTN|nr:4'-phosphopantetheinyl transferase EntD [Streptomyces zagrosensis]
MTDLTSEATAVVPRALVPATVAWAEAVRSDAEPDVLFPEEEALLGRSVLKRRREFTTVRACARRAMAGLGLPPVPVLPGKRGEPGWPKGLVGSMTHCDGYRAAALAPATVARSIGIDAEPHAPLPDGVLDVVTLAPERERGKEIADGAWGDGPVHWDRLLFSAKESVFKAWYPLARRELDFTEAELTFEAEPRPAGDTGGPDRVGTFHARLLPSADIPQGFPFTGFDGRWVIHDGFVVTAIVVPTATIPSARG